jgi:hypothetical protein
MKVLTIRLLTGLLLCIAFATGVAKNQAAAQGLSKMTLAVVPIQSTASDAFVPRIVLVEATERLVNRISELDNYTVLAGFGSAMSQQDIDLKKQSGEICAEISENIGRRKKIDRILCTFVDGVSFLGARKYRSLVSIEKGVIQVKMTGRIFDFKDRSIVTSVSAVGSSRVEGVMFGADSGITILTKGTDYLTFLKQSVLNAVENLELFFL